MDVEKKSRLALIHVAKRNENQFICLNKITELLDSRFLRIHGLVRLVMRRITSTRSSDLCDL
jgi:hypothetical protein